MKYAKLFLAFAACLLLASCESLNVRPLADSASSGLAADEQRLWKRAEEFQEVLARSSFVNPHENPRAYLNDILHKIVPDEIKAAGYSLRVYVLNDPSFNAFVLPNGTMYIHSGLLAGLDNEAGLVTVMAHELAHFTNRDNLKWFRNIKNKSAFFSVISVTTAGFGVYADLGNIFLQFGFLAAISGYSRDMEDEADRCSFQALQANGYEVLESVKAFEALGRYLQEEKIKEPYFFSTHPKVQDRIRNFTRFCRQAEAAGAEGPRIVNRDLYVQKIKPILLDNAAWDIKIGHFKSAARGISRYVELAPDDPLGYYSFGCLYRQRKEPKDEQLAVENYRKAIGLDSSFAPAHRDLGLLYYKEKKQAEAVNEFRIYLKLSPEAMDAGYIRGYLEELTGGEGK